MKKKTFYNKNKNNSSESPSANTDVKNSQGVNNKNDDL